MLLRLEYSLICLCIDAQLIPLLFFMNQTLVIGKPVAPKCVFLPQEFLAKFPDPTTTFASDEKEMKENYKAHVAAQLKHDFPDFKQSYVNHVMEKHHSHLLPIIREVEAVRADILGES